MINGRKVVVVLPAYNAARTLKRTFDEISTDVVDEIILTDDASTDETINLAGQLGIRNILRHANNLGYGANQKTCYKKALELNADIIVMLHPDYQYTPKLIPVMAQLIANNVFSVVMGSRILGNGALKGGMPVYKYIGNRVLTFFQNLCTGAKLSEYHSGYRAFSRNVLEKVEFTKLSNDHVFDNELISEILLAGYSIGEITCPANYFDDASSLNLRQSLWYGVGVMGVSVRHLFKRFERNKK